MKLSDGEKLIIVMLCDIYKHMQIKGEVNSDFVKDAMTDGQGWALKRKYPGLFDVEECPEEVVNEVYDILDMFRILEQGYKFLSPADKITVEKEAAPFGRDVEWEGFDANRDPHYGVARTIIERLELYQEFKGRALDSHHHVIGSYRRMLKPFKSILRNLDGRDMSVAEIVSVLKERTHPSQRT